MNYGTNCLGPGARSNAAIGRAMAMGREVDMAPFLKALSSPTSLEEEQEEAIEVPIEVPDPMDPVPEEDLSDAEGS